MTGNTVHIVVLYAEFQGYNAAALNAVGLESPEIHFHVVSWDQNKKSKYQLEPLDNATFYKRSEYSPLQLVDFIYKVSPALIICSARSDKGYLKALLRVRKDFKTVGITDTPYNGSVRHRIQVLFSYFFYRRYYDYLWVAGTRQFEFSKRLGFPNSNVFKRSLVCDSVFYEQQRRIPAGSYPKTIYYVGRFSEEKGVMLLYEVFKSFCLQNKEWKLVFIGNGPLKDQLIENEQIQVLPFKNYREICAMVDEIGVLCLPSYSEQWGLVLNEFAALGVPIICSDTCGAATDFVINGYNGAIFKTRDPKDLLNKLNVVTAQSPAQLHKMGENGKVLAYSYHPKMFAAALSSILSEGVRPRAAR